MARYSARGRAFSVFPAEGRSRSLLLPAACRLRLRIKGARGAVITYNDCLIQAEACLRMASRGFLGRRSGTTDADGPKVA